MRSRAFQQIDVFGAEPYLGNPLAVVLDAEGLSDAQMQAFANWTNLSETTFLLPPTEPRAHYRVRIFTPDSELPFAGHPTLGSAHAWLSTRAASGQGGEELPSEMVQECGAGLVTIRRTPQGLAFAAPPLLRSGAVDAAELAEIAAELGIGVGDIVASAWADNGPGWVAVQLTDAAAVAALTPVQIKHAIGVVGFHPPGHESLYEVRAFYPLSTGVAIEDPVTGSLNASLAQWLLERGEAAAPYTATQGSALGRRGLIQINRPDNGPVWVGGNTITCVDGTVAL